jgi:hypothetical protein
VRAAPLKRGSVRRQRPRLWSRKHKLRMKSRTSTVVISVLAGALVASNAWWLYAAVDSGVTSSYREQAFHEHREALAQLIAVVPAVSEPAATRESILLAARSAAKDSKEFEKDGFVWVGYLGYRFSDGGRLREVRTSWSPF